MQIPTEISIGKSKDCGSNKMIYFNLKILNIVLFWKKLFHRKRPAI